MPAKYKLQDEQYFMLTYPTIPDGFDTDGLIAVLERLGCDYRIGRELHQDGKPHLHAMCCFDEPYTDNDARTTFKIGTRVPNIRVRRVKPERGWDYVGKHAGTKEGHYIVGEKGVRPGGDGDGSERPSNDAWHEIILARTREEFFDSAARLAPRQLACSFSSLTAYADWKYRPVSAPWSSPDGEFSVPFELKDWVDDNVRGAVGKCSPLPGPPRGGHGGISGGAPAPPSRPSGLTPCHANCLQVGPRDSCCLVRLGLERQCGLDH